MRRAFSAVLAAVVVTTSAFPASADTYYFRYKAPVSWEPSEPGGPVDPYLGEGNDITIFFTGVIGQPFSKTIPVKTKDVVKWKIDSGKLQAGLVLDAAGGLVSGTPAGDAQQKVAVLLGYDVSGALIARAKITFRFHKPLGESKEFTFYGHTGNYMYRKIPTSAVVDKWSAITTPLPDDFHTDGGYLAGTPSSAFETGLGFIGYDYIGKEVAFTYGDLIVEDGPTFEPIADQQRHPSEGFELKAKVKHKLGDLVWKLVPLDGHASMVRVNQDGEIRGRIGTFNTSLRFQVEAMDIDGTKGRSNVFTLSTTGPDTEISELGNQSGVVGEPFSVKITGKDLVGATSWSVKAGSLPDGILLDPDTGVIAGTPLREQMQESIVVAVDTSEGTHAESQPFNFVVLPHAAEVVFSPVDVRTGVAFKSAGPTLREGVISPYRFDPAEGAEIAPALTVDYTSAVVTGMSETAGDFSVPFNFINGDGHQKVFTQPITVREPLALSYADPTVVYRRLPAAAQPVVDPADIVGQPSFLLASGVLPDGLSIDKATGAITGTPAAVSTSVDLSVALSDESGDSAVSNSFEIDVQDRPAVLASAVSTEVERYVDNEISVASAQNAFDGVTFELVRGQLPQGLSFGEDGVVRGNTQAALGVYDGLQVMATDGEGYTALSPVFTLTVVQPKDLQQLDEVASSAQWTQGVPFSLALPRPANAFGNVAYSVSNLPGGVRVSGDALVGTVDELGAYSFPMTLTDDAGRVLTGAFSLTILEPMTAALEGTGKREDVFTDELVFDLPRGSAIAVHVSVKDGIAPLVYAISGTLPDGLAKDDDVGTITGIPVAEKQSGNVLVRVTDAAGTVQDLTATLKVVERLPVELSYSPASPAGFVGKEMAPISPSIENAIGPISYSLQGSLPPGAVFDGATGRFYGKPLQNGAFRGLTVTATDSEGANFAGVFGPFEIGIQAAASMTLPSSTIFTVRAGHPFVRQIDVGSATAPFEFFTQSGAPLPYGLDLGSSDGKVSGTLSPEGSYPAGVVTVADYFDQKKSTKLTVKAVGPLAIEPPTQTEFNQYQSVSVPPAATNVVGSATYALAAGSLPAGLSLQKSTGYITGTADVMEERSGIVVSVTDGTGERAQTQPFSLKVGPRLPLLMETAETYGIKANVAYKLTLQAQNAVGGAQFVLTGALPPGIAFDAGKGVFSGAAMDIGFFNVGVKVTDTVGASVERRFSFIVETNGLPITMATEDFVTKVGHQILTAEPSYGNTVGTVKFSADAEISDYGLSIDPDTGTISGAATQLLDITPNIHITDASNRLTSVPVRIQVVPDLAIDVPDVINLPVNRAIDPYVTAYAKNATGSVVWSISGNLPTNMNWSNTYHRFSGRPKEMGTFDVVVTATEKTGFGQTATHPVKINVVSDGVAPTISVTPANTGYSTRSNAVIYPKIQNAKTGDVVTLAPDSAPLPPGFAIQQYGSGGAWRLLKNAPVDDANAGIYSGIKLRITAADGLHGDSEPFTIIYKTPLSYPDLKISQNAYAPIALPTPALASGKLVDGAVVQYSFLTDRSGGTLKIEPATGEVSGHVTKTLTNTVAVTTSHNGKTLANGYYHISVTATLVGLSVEKVQVAYTGLPFPDFPVGLTNPLQGSTLSVIGDLPPGVSFDPATGRLTGVPTQSGQYPLELVYTDPYQTVSQPFTASIEQSAPDGEGYRFVKISTTGGAAHLYNFVVRNQFGQSIMHMTSAGAGTVSDGIVSILLGAKHVAQDFPRGGEQVLDLPTSVSGGSVIFSGHGTASKSAAVISVSTDGMVWRDLETVAFTSANDSYSLPFSYSQPQIVLEARGVTTKAGFAISSPAPSVFGAQSGVRFYSDEAVAAGLSVDPSTGVISGTIAEPQTLAVDLSVTDDTGRVTTRPVTFSVLPRMTLTAADTTTLEANVAMTPIKVMRANAYGNATWDAADQSLLPPGVSFNTTSGQFEGVPTLAGSYGPIVVTSRDSLNDMGSSNAIVIVVQDTNKLAFKTVDEQSLPIAQKRGAYLFDLKMLLADDTSAAAKDGAAWKIAWGALGNFPDASTDIKLVGSVLSGTPRSSGSVEIAVTATYAGVSKSQTYVLNSVLPTISMSLNGDEGAAGIAGYNEAMASVAAQDLLTVQNIDKTKVRWSVSLPPAVGAGETAGLPSGVALNAITGLISGTPTTIGKFRFVLKATFDDTNAVAEHLEATQQYLLVVEGASTRFLSVSVGTLSACGIALDDAVYCWGSNANGRLGNGSPTASYIPVKVQGIVGIPRQISVGSGSACAVTQGDAMYCWGQNNYGQVKSGTTADQTTAVASALSGVKSVSVGEQMLCAAMNDTSLKCWGWGDSFRTMTGSTAATTTPQTVIAAGVKGVATKAAHTCADLADGTSKCVGYRYDGRLGDGVGSGGATGVLQNVQTSSGVVLAGVKETVVSGGGTCHLMDEGSVYCHGRGQEGGSGNGTLVSNLWATKVPGLSGVTQLAATSSTGYCALTVGTVKCWGNNPSGEMGNGAVGGGVSVPTEVRNLEGPVASVAAGGGGACLVYQNGSAACWGQGVTIGNGSNTRQLYPTKVGG